MTKLYFLILLLLGCTVKNPNEIREANVSAIPLTRLTSYRLSCESFETFLEKSSQTKKVKNEDLTELDELLTKSEITSDTSIDVRGELLITFHDNKNQKLCFNQFGVFYDGTKYFKNEPLLQFLLNKKLAFQ